MPRSAAHPILPHWRGSIAGLVLLGLLMHYHQVLDLGAKQAALRREATALHSAALWRCKAMPERRLREHCLQQLTAAAHHIAALGAQNNLTVAALEQFNR